MQKLFYFLIVLTLMLSCSDKYSSIYKLAPAPHLSFDRDTMHLRERDPLNITGKGILWLHSDPSDHQVNIQFSDTSGKVHFKYRDVYMQDSKPVIVAGDSTSLFVSCDKPGVYSVDFYLTDQLGKTISRQLVVNCTADLQIKTSLTAKLIDSSMIDNWAYQFDASCFKPDGQIVAYHFTVNGNEMHTNVPYFFWTFHSRGEQTISLYATDDLLKLSDTSTIKIIIP
jgi:hypothetical protein